MVTDGEGRMENSDSRNLPSPQTAHIWQNIFRVVVRIVLNHNENYVANS